MYNETGNDGNKSTRKINIQGKTNVMKNDMYDGGEESGSAQKL